MELVADEVAALSEELEAAQRALKDCFDKLPAAKRELLTRYYSKNETTQVIAAESGRTCDATRQSLVRRAAGAAALRGRGAAQGAGP